MTATELKKLAEAATPGPWIAGGASVTAKETEDCSGLDAKLKGGNGQQNARNSRYIAAANPAAILKLLAINAELVEALDELVEIVQHAIDNRSTADMDSFTLQPARAALAKAEGGEL